MKMEYATPTIFEIKIYSESILCTSGEQSGTGFGTSLEEMTENDYTFNW